MAMRRSPIRAKFQLSAIIASMLVMIVGCTNKPDPAPESSDQSSAHDTTTSPWRSTNGADHVIAFNAENETEAFTAAVAEARRTMEEARGRWIVATADQKRNWSIKWAARTVEGGVEHVWVRPATWSRWRIEGVLLSAPTRELDCGASTGDHVSFSSDQLTDWLYLITGDASGPRNGGFTLDALAEQFGDPASSRP